MTPTVFHTIASEPRTPLMTFQNAITQNTAATIAPWMGSTVGIPVHIRAPFLDENPDRSRTARSRRSVSR